MLIGVFVVRFLENREKNQTVLESIEDGSSNSLTYGASDEKNISVEAGTVITPAKTAAGVL